MTLHEAIEKLLLQEKRSMTASEIAEKLNRNKWYTKQDGSKIAPSQISARTNNYEKIFGKDTSQSPQHIYLIHKKKSR